MSDTDDHDLGRHSGGATAGSFDAYSPAEIAQRIESAGVAKAHLSALQTVTLAILAGAFIAFGAMLYTTVIAGATPPTGPLRLLGGAAFSLGLVLVVIAGAELFTGNNLLVMAWADRRIRTAHLARNWVLVYAGNLVGAVATAVLVWVSGVMEAGDGTVALKAGEIARAKLALDPFEAFVRGVLCNTLVCLAVWLSYAARDVTGKAVAILFPITAFVALGFEHSIANMYLIPVGLMAAPLPLGPLEMGGALLANLAPVTLGNIVGGSVLVALVYWIIYGRAH